MLMTLLITLAIAVAVCLAFASAAAEPSHTNALAGTTSPYLLQHKHNPVDWMPWADAALTRAKREAKPIFLSVGYSTCHWCHVMAHESFEDEEVAKVLNENFVAIKVDREELPDVDEQYMLATQVFFQLNGIARSGGWPNSVWLLPDGRPFYAGTYFPKKQFIQLLLALADAWKKQRPDLQRNAEVMADAMREIADASTGSEPAPLGPHILEHAATAFVSTYDRDNGGFRGAPKFPPHGALRVLLAQYSRSRDLELLNVITHTLDAMRRGGVYDHVGGGFHRYATDARWFLPHFEKMLYDNAQLVRIYAEAAVVTGDARYRHTVAETFDWVQREMTNRAGGFYSALDADSEGEEGKYYLWRYSELLDVLGEEAGKRFAAAYGATVDGTYYEEARPHHRPGTNVLFLSDDAAADDLAAMRAKLLEVRRKRVPPHLDDKVLAGWNGLMIEALAYAGRALDEPRYTDAARAAADFILTQMRSADGRLVRSWRHGATTGHGYLDDYAFVARGLVELHAATDDKRYVDEARRVADLMIAGFHDPTNGALYQTSSQHDELILRSKGLGSGGNTPFANGVAAESLLRLAIATGETRYAAAAVGTFHVFAGAMTRQPHAAESLIASLPMLLDAADRFENLTDPVQPVVDPSAHATAGAPPVTISAVASSLTAAPGAGMRIVLRIIIAEGYHIYAPGATGVIATAVALAEDGPFTLREIEWPQSRTHLDRALNSDMATYEGVVSLGVAVNIAADANPGPAPLVLTVNAQACDDQACLIPQTFVLRIPITIGELAQ